MKINDTVGSRTLLQNFISAVCNVDSLINFRGYVGDAENELLRDFECSFYNWREENLREWGYFLISLVEDTENREIVDFKQNESWA